MATAAVLVSAALLMQAPAELPAPAYPRFEDSPRCSPRTEADWSTPCGLLRLMKVAPLAARPGDRIYRETWNASLIRRGVWFGQGSITLTIRADGRRFLQTPWRSGSIPLRNGELADFEARLAQSEFARLGQWNTTVYRDQPGVESVCIDGVVTALEAIVDGRYRLVYFDNCGVASQDVALALDDLFVLAAAKSGHRYPFNPEHPTYRGS